MANVTAKQIINDGPRNHTVKLTGVLDTVDVASTVILDPSTMSSITTQGNTPPTRIFVDRIEYDISDGLNVDLLWDATTPLLMASLYGRGAFKESHTGGFPDNSGAGITGSLRLQTRGFQAGTPASYTITLWCKKS